MGDGKSSLFRSLISEKIVEDAKNRKITILSALILISGLFYLVQIFDFPDFGTKQAAGEVVENIVSREAGKCYFQAMLEEKEAVLISDKKGNCRKLLAESPNLLVGAVVKKEKKSRDQEMLEAELYQLVGDDPIREMVPTIATFDRRVAAFIVGIARKESSWGRHVPTLDGEDCFNYWGFKGRGSRGVAMGYGCFASPEEGARTIGDRISKLMSQKLDTPSEMVVWKCGSTCAGHDPAAVTKWISDVALFYNRITKAS